MTDNLRISRNITQLCEYMYRLGVLHSSSTGDRIEVANITEQEDHCTTFHIHEGDNKGVLTESLYLDILITYCNQMRLNELRNALRYNSTKWIQKPVCVIANFYYRKGLVDGLSVDVKKGRLFFSEVGTGLVHDFLLSQGKFKFMEYMDKIKVDINNLHRKITEERSSQETASGKKKWGWNMYKLSCFIGEAQKGEKE